MKRTLEVFASSVARGALAPAVVGFAAFAAAILLPGCVTEPEGIPTMAATEQADIPAPDTFVFDFDRSYSVEPPTPAPEYRFRSWRGVYRGDGQVGLLVPWYVQNMPRLGWSLTAIGPKGDRASFEKGNEVAEVQVSRELDLNEGRYVTLIQATVRPLGPEERSLEQNLAAPAAPAARVAPVSPPRGSTAAPVPALPPRGASAAPAAAVPPAPAAAVPPAPAAAVPPARAPAAAPAPAGEEDLEAIEAVEETYPGVAPSRTAPNVR